MSDTLLTIAQYTAAFETWAGVSKLTDGQRAVLVDSLAHLRAAFADDTPRAADVYCAAFESYLSERDEDPNHDASRLRLLITKSCLLDRLIHCGEALRTVPCPEHKGRWSGIHLDPCPHGCSIGCGCTTGWLPSVETAINYGVSACRQFSASQMERAKMTGLLRGMKRAPTLAEAAKHDGRWLVHAADVRNAYVVDIIDGRAHRDGHSWPLAEFVAANPGALWRPINKERDIVAWPEVTP
jgi:hypothetical protein